MCDSCDAIDEADKTRVSARVAALARQIEFDMPGERAPEEAWNVFFGSAGGAISWEHHKRMLASCSMAAEADTRRTASDI